MPTKAKRAERAEDKAYRSVYPSVESSTDPPQEQILKQVPDIIYPPECEGALCTLLKNHANQAAKEKPQ